MARGWENIARDGAQTVGFWLLMGLITYLGIGAVAKIEATRTRLFLVVVVFGVAFGAASLVAHLLKECVPTDRQPDDERIKIWPRWYSELGEPIVCRRYDHKPYSYVVLPRPSSREQQKAPVTANPLEREG